MNKEVKMAEHLTMEVYSVNSVFINYMSVRLAFCFSFADIYGCNKLFQINQLHCSFPLKHLVLMSTNRYIHTLENMWHQLYDFPNVTIPVAMGHSAHRVLSTMHVEKTSRAAHCQP